MTTFRLRSQLFIAALLIILGLTGSLLFFIRHTVDAEIQKQVTDGTDESVRAFESVQRQRELQLSRMGAMLADLPTMKALMSTQHAPTIQDGSESSWKLAESDLLVLAKPNGNVVALHMTKPGWSAQTAERDLKRSIDAGEDASWWYDDGRLYWVFLHPITSGAGPTVQPLGFLAVGYQVDSAVAQQLSVATNNQIALTTGDTVIASTLPERDSAELQRRMRSGTFSLTNASGEIVLDTDKYTYSSVLLHGSSPSPVRCYVMMPMVPVSSFIKRLNYSIFVAGGLAVLFGVILFAFVARTITHPLDNLVAGVKALAAGDFTYSITPRGSTELVELSTSFAQMRGQLQALQQQRIESERIAALARAAGSISHDLRHYLAAVVANAEFLYEADSLKLEKDEIYEEIKTAANQMTDLIDSLRELSYQRSAITPTRTRIDQVIRRAIEAIHSKPEFRDMRIVLSSSDNLEGMFDARKLERVFFNLILNACEAMTETEGSVVVDAKSTPAGFEIRVHDTGQGIPSGIRDSVFDPFVSSGKPNGTGLGLAIVSKIVQDHSGSVSIEQTSELGTTVLVRLPAAAQNVAAGAISPIR
ncbi:MAG TPA: HAMP domain-containing sensor histidine kinase [Candidatus Acidoferrum sp.]|jgi:signal transduction histidine kinase|nr:HAMP domain-containing sensor histidine kinase [Candidatus Acidoferrum sp.]